MTKSAVACRLWSDLRSGGTDYRVRPWNREASESESDEEQRFEHRNVPTGALAAEISL